MILNDEQIDVKEIGFEHQRLVLELKVKRKHEVKIQSINNRCY